MLSFITSGLMAFSRNFIFLFFLLPILLVACDDEPEADATVAAYVEEEDESRALEFENKFLIRLPHDMHPVEEKNEAAAMHYCNDAKNHYVMVIGEEASTVNHILNLDTTASNFDELKTRAYADLVYTSTQNAVERMYDESGMQKAKIMGLDAWVFHCTAEGDGSSIFYLFGFVFSNGNYYQIIQYTSPELKPLKHEAMKDILRSFRTIEKG